MSTLPEPAAPAERKSLVRRVLPFALAILLISIVVARLDLNAFVRELGRLDYPLYLAFTFVFVLALLSADTFATVYIYRKTIAPIRYRDFFVIRGASYLPSIVNHHLGQAFLTYFMARLSGVSLLRTAGATLLSYASWAGCVLGMASLAIVLTGEPPTWLLLPIGAGLLYLLVIFLRPRRLAETRLLGPLFDAGVGGHVMALLARLPHLAVLFLGTWVPFLFFRVDIPFPSAVAYIPILMVAVTLPITPQGLGTRDLLAAQFFEKFAPGATQEERLASLAASTTSWVVATVLVEALIGLLLMRLAVPKLEARAKTEGASTSPSVSDTP